MKRLIALLTVVLAVVCCEHVLGMGGEHPKGKLGKTHPDWPDGLLDLVNANSRVHGHWVNANDEFFYQGDTASLTRFLQVYGSLKDSPLRVVIHVGINRRSTLWGKQPKLPYDWKLLIQRRGWGIPLDSERPKDDPGYVVTVDVWLGAKLDLEELEVPTNVEVESGGEIDRFIKKHGQAAPTTDTAVLKESIPEARDSLKDEPGSPRTSGSP